MRTLILLACPLIFAAVAAYSPAASARARGLAATGCTGCHGGDANVDISLEAAGPVEPGQTVTLTLRVASNGMGNMGYFMTTQGEGEFEPGDGARVEAMGMLHTTPVRANNGVATVNFDWTAPNEIGGSDFDIFVVAGSGNGGRGGTASETRVSIVYGCEGTIYYTDFDRDGWGSSDFGTTIDCELREGFSERDGDCNENNPDINPGKEEICNERDDDCDGETDEGTVPRELHVDRDGDGFGRLTGESMMGCVPPPGFVDNADDCDDTNPNIHPDAEEVCNEIDDNCNRSKDEGLRDRCGVGLCERAASCFSDQCFPGQPLPEQCNGLDDDCDGEIDNNVVCPEPGHVCHMFRCIPSDDAAMMQAMTPDDGASMMIPDGMTLPGPTPSPTTAPEAPNSAPPEGEPDPGSTEPNNGAPSTSNPTQDSGGAAVPIETMPPMAPEAPDTMITPVLNEPEATDTGGGCTVKQLPQPGAPQLSWLLAALGAGLLLRRRRR